MKTLLLTLVFSLFLLATVSAYVPAPELPLAPQLDPNIKLSICNCRVGVDTTEPCETDGCPGTRECNSASCMIANTCEYEQCDDDYSGCNMGCALNGGACASACPPFDWGCIDACDDVRFACLEACNDTYQDCLDCDGRWSSCEKNNPCCGVTCEINRQCDEGTCVCKDTQERCNPDGSANGIDEDCDDDVDEGCTACGVGKTQACTLAGCPGVQTCDSSGEWGDCEKNNPCCGINCGNDSICDASTGDCVCKDTLERCGPGGQGDGIDNDCDGQIDEDCGAAEPQPPANATPPGTGDFDQQVATMRSECLGKGGSCVEQCVGCAPQYMDVCPSGTVEEGVCRPQKPGIIGGTREVCCVPDTGGTTPVPGIPPDTGTAPVTGTGGQELDMNMILLLIIIVVLGIVVVSVVLALKKRGGGSPAPQQPQTVIVQPPQ